jgi:hypothetical protein
MQPDGPALLVGLVALLILLAAIHQIGRGVAARWSASGASGRWTWRSTVAMTIGMCLLFAAGIAVVGATHQVMWIAIDRHPSTVPQSIPRWSDNTGGPLSTIANARQAARRTMSRNHLRQLAMALQNYHDAYSQLPAGATIGSDGRAHHGWMFPLTSIGLMYYVPRNWSDEPWDGPNNREFGLGALPDVTHPDLGYQFDEHGFALMHYAGNVHIFPNNHGMSMSQISDGTSNTLAIGEVAENFQPWASPYNRRDPADGINDVPWGFGGPPWQHGAQFAFADGSVRFLSKNIDRKLLRALGTPAAGDNPGHPGEW